MTPQAAADLTAPARADAPAALGERYEAVLGASLTRGEPFALADFPDYANIGDHAIYAGQVAALDAVVGRRASYACTVRNYAPGDLEAHCPEGPILLQGGGNFGDLYPHHQALRLEVLRRHPGRRVVQLPQSIHFSSPEGAEETKRAIGAARDVLMLVRDAPSLEFARAHFDCDARLCPDGAYALRRLTPPGPAEGPVLNLLREDKESTGLGREALAALGPVLDWPVDSRRTRGLVALALDRRVIPRLSGLGAAMALRERLYRGSAWRMVTEGARILSRGERVVSDRLHAHILSSLLRKPHIVLDNSYGKINRYIDAWGDDGLACVAATPAEAVALLGSAPHTT